MKGLSKGTIQPYQLNFPTNLNLKTQKILEQTIRQFGSEITLQNIQELQLQVDLNEHQKDYQQIKYILETLLSYPSTRLAELHRKSNKLGKFDLALQQQKIDDMNPVQAPMIDRLQYCPCCGFKKQDQQLKICSDKFEDISNMGISTYLYFQTVINLAILLTIAFFVFSIFALTTNIISSDKVTSGNTLKGVSVTSNSDIILLSLGSKIYLSSQYLWQLIVQTWIGVTLIVVWFGVFIALQILQQKQCKRVAEECISAADYSIIIQGIPTTLRKQDLQAQFKIYVDQLKQIDSSMEQKYFENFKIQKLNIARPFMYQVSKDHTQKLKAIYQKIQNYQKKLAELILSRVDNPKFQKQLLQRQQICNQYLRTIQDKQEQYKFIIQQVKNTYKVENKQITTTGFITLDSNYSKKLILLKNQSGVLDKIRNALTCFVWNKEFVLNAQDQHFRIKISEASQPQDIIWANIGLSKLQILKKRFITFLVTILILGLSFVITYGLSTVQNNNKQNRYISIIISLVISFFNFVILQALCYLTYFQRDFTSTRRQTSLAVKGVLAQLVNSILIPILVNRFIKDKHQIYQKNGLAQDIFILSITTALASPIAKIIDVNYIFVRLVAYYKNKPSSKLLEDQSQLNKYYQLMEFQHGYEYVYIINLYLFNCFFISLQPIIVVFAVCGYIIMYWAQKYSLFTRCRRPVPGTKILNDVLVQFIYAGPLFYSLGSLVFVNLLPQSIFNIELNSTLVANLVAIGISVLILLLPYSLIYDCFSTQQQRTFQKYQDNRIFMPSQYDRLNPLTAEQAFGQYMNFIDKKKEQIDEQSKQVKGKLIQIFDHQGKNNFDKNIDQPILNILRGKHAQQMNRILRPQIQHLNPNLIRLHLLPEQANPIAPYLVQSCIRNQRVQSGFMMSKIISDEKKLGFTQMPSKNYRPTMSILLHHASKMSEQKMNEQQFQQNDNGLIPSLVDIIIPSNNKVSFIQPQKQYNGMKQTNPFRNPLFNLDNNPYNPPLMRTFRMMDPNNISCLGSSMISKQNNYMSSKIKNSSYLKNTYSEVKDIKK